MQGCRAFVGGAPGARRRSGGLALLIASIPFIVNGRVGILGVGLVNDDMASHLLIADWLNTRVGDMPGLDRQRLSGGAARARRRAQRGAGDGPDRGVRGHHARHPRCSPRWSPSRRCATCGRVPRVLAAALVALPYLAAAYLAQGAFKEPIEALFLLSFALLLARRDDRSRARCRWR